MLVCPPKQRKRLTIILGTVDESETDAMAHALDRHLRACPQDPKGVDDYDWVVIVTGVPRSAGFGQWSA